MDKPAFPLIKGVLSRVRVGIGDQGNVANCSPIQALGEGYPLPLTFLFQPEAPRSYSYSPIINAITKKNELNVHFCIEYEHDPFVLVLVLFFATIFAVMIHQN